MAASTISTKRTLAYIAPAGVLCVFLVLMLLPDLGAIASAQHDRARGRLTPATEHGANIRPT